MTLDTSRISWRNQKRFQGSNLISDIEAKQWKQIKMIELSDDDLLPRMSMLLSPKSIEYDDSPVAIKKPVSWLHRKFMVTREIVFKRIDSKFTWALLSLIGNTWINKWKRLKWLRRSSLLSHLRNKCFYCTWEFSRSNSFSFETFCRRNCWISNKYFCRLVALIGIDWLMTSNVCTANWICVEYNKIHHKAVHWIKIVPELRI